jgi:hypothetical protein
MPKARNPKSKKPDSGLRRILVASDPTAYSDRASDRAVMLAGITAQPFTFFTPLIQICSPSAIYAETSERHRRF